MAERIGTSYRRQYRKPEDAIREREEEARREMLENVGQLAPEDMPTAIYAEAFDKEIEKYAPETDESRPDDEQVVNSAIDQAVQQSAAKVEQASLTGEQRLARAIAVELRSTVDNVKVPDVDEEEEEDDYNEDVADLYPDDPIIDHDDLGQPVYQDQSTGEEYVLGTPDEAA